MVNKKVGKHRYLKYPSESQFCTSPHTAGESEVEVEVVQRVVLLWGAGARQGQACDLTAQPVPLLQVQGAVAPVLVPSNEGGVMYGHVGYTGWVGGGGGKWLSVLLDSTTTASVIKINIALALSSQIEKCFQYWDEYPKIKMSLHLSSESM